MTREEAAKFAATIKAYADGKTIQFRDLTGGWRDMKDSGFGSPPERYRVKPELDYGTWRYYGMSDRDYKAGEHYVGDIYQRRLRDAVRAGTPLIYRTEDNMVLAYDAQRPPLEQKGGG